MAIGYSVLTGSTTDFSNTLTWAYQFNTTYSDSTTTESYPSYTIYTLPPLQPLEPLEPLQPILPIQVIPVVFNYEQPKKKRNGRMIRIEENDN